MDPEKQPEDTKEDAPETRSVFHEDENLQDEQEQFDKDNAHAKIDWGAFDELINRRESERETADKPLTPKPIGEKD